MINFLLALAILIGGLVSSSGTTVQVNYAPPQPRVQAQIEGQELVAQRTKTTKVYQVGPNQYTLRASVGAQHYRDAGGVWQEIDNNWYPAVAPWNWQMTQDSYTTRALSNLTAGQVIEYSNQGEYVRFQPMALQWTNNLSQVSQISIPKNVPVSVSGGRISWVNGYGSGRDFAWINQPERLVTLLTLNGPLPTPSQTIINGGNPVAELNFIFDPSSALDIYVNGTLWDKRATVNSALAVEFRRSGVTLFAFAPPFAYDSEGSPAVVTAQLRRTGNNLFISVRVPYSWLLGAAYPVTIDPTFNIAASADDVSILSSTFNATTPNFTIGDVSSSRRDGALRFVSLNIQNSSTINSAFVSLVSNNTLSGTTVNINISAEAVDNATQIVSTADFDARVLTAAVAWNSIPAHTAGTSYDTPSIVSPTQSVVNRAGWVSGNAMNIFMKNNASSSNARRQFESWDGTSYTEPILTITWTAPGGAVSGAYYYRMYGKGRAN